MERSIINPALSLLVKHLVIGRRQKALYFSAFHWSSHRSLVSIGQHFVTTRVVHLPKLNYRSGLKIIFGIQIFIIFVVNLIWNHCFIAVVVRSVMKK